MNFTSTDWTALGIARDRLAPPGKSAFSALIERYQPAIVFYIGSHFRLSAPETEELAQEFILDKFIENNLLERADRNRGKFRALLTTAINRFVIDRLRRKGTQVVGAEVTANLAAEGAVDPFDAAWAESMVTDALSQTAKELTHNGRGHFWELFFIRVVQPAYEGTTEGDFAQLAERLGFESTRAASNALTTAKRTFQRILESQLDPDDVSDIDQQVAEVMQILSRRAVGRSGLRRFQ